MMTEVLMSSGDFLNTRHDFVDAMVPELLKYMMKMGHPVSIYDLRNEGFFEEMRKKFPVAGRGQIDGLGGAKVMIRKALKTLVDKGYVVQDDPSESHRGMRTTFSINPQMAQQAGQEYFPKPEGIMENKIKLTKQKLEQLIIEAYIRRVGDEGKPINYPEYADKLTSLAKQDYLQARELADALDEPINIELNTDQTQKIGEFRNLSTDGPYYVYMIRRNAYDNLGLYGKQIDEYVSSGEWKKDIPRVIEYAGLNVDPEYFEQAVNHQFKFGNMVDQINPINEATGEQKRQQRRDAYASKEKDRRKFKTRIKRQNRVEPVEPPIKGDPIDFDPIKDLGKAMKKRYKDLEVRANGEEIED
jgi:hypothetical protein